MKPIGGYFQLELFDRGSFPHSDGVLLNSGRNALEYVLRALGDVKHIYIPYYTCEVVLEPLIKLQIPYTFYHINEHLELAYDIGLSTGGYLIYTNYFGIKDSYCNQLANQYGDQLIIDNAQAWYATPPECAGVIYSPRKFVGIPDGGVAYCKKHIEIDEIDMSYDRCSHLLKRYDLGASGGYDDFHINSAKLHNQPIRNMSELTTALLRSIDFDQVSSRRWQNFKQLHKELGDKNLLSIPKADEFACPMVYPFITNEKGLKQRLISDKIFVATYWPNVLQWCNPTDIEYHLTNHIIPLPIDQRYGTEDMLRIIDIIKAYE